MVSTSETASTTMSVMRSQWKIRSLLLLDVLMILGIYHIIYSSIFFSTNDVSKPHKRLTHQQYKLTNHVEVAVSENIPELNDTQDYEQTLHRLHEHIEDLWNYASHELNEAIEESDSDKRNKTLQILLANLEHRKSSLLGEQQRLRSVDGRKEIREQEAAIASDLVQRRLRELHNPSDCKAARKLICNLNYACGFGCYVHHIAYCLRVAYSTNRLVLFDQEIWNYKPRWRSLFEPLSEKCSNESYDLIEAVIWPLEGSDEAHFVFVGDKSKIPLGVPEELANRVMKFNADPGSWFVGQIMKYILRPRREFQKTIDDTIAKINYQHPIVGVHVRRTDKLIWEAEPRALEEYMQKVQEYWIAQDVARRPGTLPAPRRVYLASDDVAVLKEARRMYPDVEFIGDENIARNASVVDRWNKESLMGMVVDLILLSRADYLVCTFTSNVGRVAYELMQANRVDASESYASLDESYYFFGNYRLIVKQRHIAQQPEEMSLEIGDVIDFVKYGYDRRYYGYGEVLSKHQKPARAAGHSHYKSRLYPLRNKGALKVKVSSRTCCLLYITFTQELRLFSVYLWYCDRAKLPTARATK